MGVITHTDEIIDFKQKVVKIVEEECPSIPDVHELELEVSQLSASVLRIGGEVEGKADTKIIADDYDPTKNPASRIAYNLGSYVIYNQKLYKARFSIYTKAGAFNSDMWDIVTEYDAQETYGIGDVCVYNDNPYKCTSEGTTGEWDSTKWTQQNPISYNVSFTNYQPGNMVVYDGDYYVANSTYENAPVGPFDATRWSETQVTSNLTTTISQYTYSSESSGETKVSQVSIPVSGVAPSNIFRATISTYNDAGQECMTDCNFKAGLGFMGGATGKCVLVIPGYVSVKFLILTVSLVSSGTNRINITLDRITEIGLVEGDLSISTDTEMIFPPMTVRLESLSPNVITQTP